MTEYIRLCEKVERCGNCPVNGVDYDFVAATPNSRGKLDSQDGVAVAIRTESTALTPDEILRDAKLGRSAVLTVEHDLCFFTKRDGSERHSRDNSGYC